MESSTDIRDFDESEWGLDTTMCHEFVAVKENKLSPVFWIFTWYEGLCAKMKLKVPA
jgi:hypothetical protein